MSSSLKILKLSIVSVILSLSIAYILFEYCRTGPNDIDLLDIAELKTPELNLEKIDVANIPSVQVEATNAIKETNLGHAEELYNKILLVSPKNVDALYGLGVVYAQEGDDKKASEMLRDTFSIDVEKIKTALEDPRLETLKKSSNFQSLLRKYSISIPEMNGQINNPPVQEGGFG